MVHYWVVLLPYRVSSCMFECDSLRSVLSFHYSNYTHLLHCAFLTSGDITGDLQSEQEQNGTGILGSGSGEPL